MIFPSNFAIYSWYQNVEETEIKAGALFGCLGKEIRCAMPNSDFFCRRKTFFSGSRHFAEALANPSFKQVTKDDHLPWSKGLKRVRFQWIWTVLVAPRRQLVREHQGRTDDGQDIVKTLRTIIRYKRACNRQTIATTFCRCLNLLKRTSTKMSL